MKLLITIPSLCKAYARKIFFCLMSSLCLCMLTLSGCAPFEGHIDYSDRQLIMFLPIINRLDKEKLPDQYYDGRLVTDYRFAELSKSGYDVVQATGVYKDLDNVISKGLFVSPQLLDSIVSGSPSGSIAPSEYAYVIVMTIDSIKRIELQTARRIEVSVFLINNRDGSLYWSNKGATSWAVVGDLTEATIMMAAEAIAPTKGEDTKSTRSHIGAAFEVAISECPLLSNR
jgi:hypothetical protein